MQSAWGGQFEVGGRRLEEIASNLKPPTCNILPYALCSMLRPLILAFALSIVSFGNSFAADIRLLTNREFFPALEDKVRNAREEIMVSVYLFRTTESQRNLARRLREELISAASRGVRVYVLLEREKGGRKGSSLNEDNAYTARILSKGGAKVYFDDQDTVTHTKVVVIDRRFVFIGSHNFTDSALRWNNEASVMIDSPQIAREAASFIKGIE
jgi:phosphatidylserine/phosphatidylglycerophosphate/cardiolipin synthase-like enzyme